MSLQPRRRRSSAPLRRKSLAFFSLLLIFSILLFNFSSAIPTAHAISNTIVISQIYGGGGNSGATLKNDFIELYNRGTTTVDVSGWSVQYASATGTTYQVTNLCSSTTAGTCTIAPGKYFLVQQAQGAGGTTNLPTPDATGTIPLSGTAGKVALVSSRTALTGACPTTNATVVDFVGFGTTANCFEGTGQTPAPSNTTAVLRKNGGSTETDNNAADFEVGSPNPRNSGTGGATPLTISVNDVSQAEGNSGTTVFTFTVSLSSPAPAGGITFDIATADNTATAGSDYVARALTGQTIPEGSQTYTFDVTVNGDTSGEPAETFFVNITNVVGATAGDVQGLGTIQNDDVSITPIYQIQGSGSTSSFANQSVTTSGIVTGIKQGSSGGFFIQDPSGDGNTETSDGIFVFTGSNRPAAAVIGNSVQVTGTVVEFTFNTDPNSPPITEISAVSSVVVTATNQTLPAAVTLTAAETTAASETANPLDTLEEYEGMRVSVSSLTVISPTEGNVNEANATATSTGVFYGVVTGVARPFREPGVALPDPVPSPAPCCVPRFDTNPERLRIDSDSQPGTTAINVTAGATVSNLTGVLDYSFRTYTILPEAATTPTIANLAVATPVPVANADELTVGSFNLERFFDTTNDGIVIENGTQRDTLADPVLTQVAFNNRLNKASLAIRNVLRTPDVLGVIEVENLSTLQTLAAKINADAVAAGQPDPQYVAYLEEGNDVGGIDVGFLVKSARVTVVGVTQIGKDETYTNPNTGQQETLNDRPSLVLEASVNTPSGAAFPFTVIVNHLRSLRGAEDNTADGVRVREKRRRQAEFLANYVQARQVANPDERIALVGDFNAFQFSDGLVDMIGTIKGQPTPADQVVLPSPDLVNPDLINLVETLPANQRYSFIFDGSAQVLDHILVNDDFNRSFSRFAFARVDADFPDIYRNDPTRPERLSDHDAPVAYFNLAAGAEEVTSRVRVTGSGLGYSRATRTYNGTLTITNTSGQAINGPVQIVFDDLTPGVTLANATGTFAGDPYITATVGSLAPGASVQVAVRFSNPSNVRIGYTPRVYSGSFQGGNNQ